MPLLTDREFASILADETKRIQDDIAWREDEDHSPAVEFRVEIESMNGCPPRRAIGRRLPVADAYRRSRRPRLRGTLRLRRRRGVERPASSAAPAATPRRQSCAIRRRSRPRRLHPSPAGSTDSSRFLTLGACAWISSVRARRPTSPRELRPVAERSARRRLEGRADSRACGECA